MRFFNEQDHSKYGRPQSDEGDVLGELPPGSEKPDFTELLHGKTFNPEFITALARMLSKPKEEKPE